MTTYTIDTHDTVRQFVAAGIPDKQAEAIVAALSRSDADIATRTDLRQEIASVKADLQREIVAVRADLDVLRSEVKAGQSEMEAKISAAINKVLLAQIALAGLLFAAIKLF